MNGTKIIGRGLGKKVVFSFIYETLKLTTYRGVDFINSWVRTLTIILRI